MKMKLKRFLIPAIILIAGFLLMQIFLTFKKEPAKRQHSPRPKTVNAQIVKLQPVESRIEAYGRLTSAQPVGLFSEVSGVIQPGTVPFQPGQSFKKGDLLLKIDERQARLDLNSAKSDLLNALSTVLPEIKVDFPDEFPLWEAYFNRCDFDHPLPELPETENQKIRLYLSRFNVYKLYFQVQNLEIRLNKHFFWAPFDGSVVTAALRVGTTARAGSQLGEIINLENLEVEVPMPVADLAWIDRKQPVIFTSDGMSGKWTGRIKRIGSNIDERSETVPVFMSISQNGDDPLYSGLFLHASVPGKTVSDAFTVPRAAIYNENHVYLIKQGRLEYRPVQIARQETDSVILHGGIADGDTLVVELMQGVAPGMPAKMRNQPKE